MADSIAFGGIEKQHLVGFGYCLVMPNMPNIHTAIGKHQLGGGRALFRALMPASTLALCVPNRNWRACKERRKGHFRYGLTFISRRHIPRPRGLQATIAPSIP